MAIFYKPSDGWAADVIPFYWQGEYHLFYLKDYRDPAGHGEGTPWFHLGTRDFVTFTDYGEALPRGLPSEQDLFVFTGSVIEREGVFHIFYTGHNPHFRAAGKPEQAVMHAVSDDLLVWRKCPEDTFFAPLTMYEPHDWRDPFVLWNPEAREYWMLLAARLTTGPARRRGCTALCASRDLRTWVVRSPLWTPSLYYTHECPDLFHWGEWWYLLFSEFSEATVTRYRMSRSLQGPWLTPTPDTFDGRAFYAAKTVSDGRQRFLCGWNPTRETDQDEGRWQWGGALVTHELTQAADGTLAVRLPASVANQFGSGVPVAFQPMLGACIPRDRGVTITTPGSYGCALAGPLPEQCRITLQIQATGDTRGYGLLLRMSDDGDQAYFVRFEMERQRLVCDRWPRPGDIPFMVELERPLQLQAGVPLSVTVVVDGTICEIYVANQIAMSTRLYNRPRGTWGVFVSEGTATFDSCMLAAI